MASDAFTGRDRSAQPRTYARLRMANSALLVRWYDHLARAGLVTEGAVRSHAARAIMTGLRVNMVAMRELFQYGSCAV